MVGLPIAENERVETNPDLHPFACDAADVASLLRVDPSRGLDEREVAERRRRFGPNQLQSVRPRPAWLLIANQFRSLIIILLASAAAVAFATGSVVEGFAILVVLIANALVGFATEWKAGRALDALRKQTRATARARRRRSAGIEKIKSRPYQDEQQARHYRDGVIPDYF
ncbi:MAG: cation-transporting P-type ATPase [Acidobacteriota bacterium]